GAAGLPRPLQQRARRPGRHEHGRQLRHAPERRPLPGDEEPLRGQLQPRGVPGRAPVGNRPAPLHYSPRRVVLRRSVSPLSAPRGGTRVRKVPGKSLAIVGVFAAVAAIAAVVVTTATATTKHKTASVDVCVLLPDTKSSVRWVQFDAPAMKAAFKKAGVSASINNALNDPLKQKAQAQACLAAGAKVVIETALDNGSAASIEKLFTSKGGKAIDYDRQVTGGTASVYVTFDGEKVGQ